MPSPEYSAAERSALLGIAERSIEHGLSAGQPLAVDLDQLAQTLREIRASFVTLTRQGELRGCTGSLEPCRALAEDVATTAFHTAFNDPRFLPLTAAEMPAVSIEISVLSPMRRLPVRTEQDLLDALVPDVDGLVIEDATHRATFLPKVWETLPDPRAFVGELKRKAGWPRDYWSESIVVHRYHTEIFGTHEVH